MSKPNHQFGLQVKHGESAYPVDSWIELQYISAMEKGGEGANIHPIMTGGGSGQGYNDAFQMVPTMGALTKKLSVPHSMIVSSPRDNVNNGSASAAGAIDNKAFEEEKGTD